MDYGKILKRAWNILWSYRALWFFGVLVAITAAGGSGSNFNYNFGGGSQSNNNNNSSFYQNYNNADQLPFFQNMPLAHIVKDPVLNTFIWIGILVLVIVLVFAVITTILRYVSETSLIRMVDGYEETGEKKRVGKGFRMGWSRAAWRIFLQSLLLSLPTILFLVSMLLLGGLLFLVFSNELVTFGIILSVIGIALFFLSILLLALVNIILGIMQQFFWRATALENLGVFAGMRRGFEIIKHNLKDVILMWLITFGIKIGWTIALIPVSILLIPVFILLFVVGALVGAIPGLIVVGIASLFTSGVAPWIIGGIVALPIAIFIAAAPGIFLQGLFQTYLSSTWTLTYRELQSTTSGPVVVDVEPAVE